MGRRPCLSPGRLAELSSCDLKAEWARRYGALAPALSPDLLRLGIGYKLQEQKQGGISRGTRSLLRQVAAQAEEGSAKPLPRKLNRKGASANDMLHLHATPKPVELCLDALLDLTLPGHRALDAFLGSGTTLIAAEKCGRVCCGIELDPWFVDVSVERWQNLVGAEAVLAEIHQLVNKASSGYLKAGKLLIEVVTQHAPQEAPDADSAEQTAYDFETILYHFQMQGHSGFASDEEEDGDD